MNNIHLKHNEFNILVIPVLVDNFVYLVSNQRQAILFDAGEAQPIIQALKTDQLQLQQIFITHRHYDHIDGWAQMHDFIDHHHKRSFCSIEVISTPGHMRKHYCYYLPEANALFTGDTLINGGCGRLLGGSTNELFDSLTALSKFPDETLVFGGHDYLAENMRFALSIEPENIDMQSRLELYKSNPVAAIFSTLAIEKKTNPFLRAKTVEEFSELRLRKDTF